MEALYVICTDEKGKQLLTVGTEMFPCEFYNRDILRYITGDVPPHWHYELEIFLLVEGKARVTFAEAEYDMAPGEGFFVNSSVLHGVSCLSGAPCRYHSMVFDPVILSGAVGSVYDLLYLRPFLEHGIPFHVFRPGDGAQGEELARLLGYAFDVGVQREYGYEFLVREALSRIFLILRSYAGKETARKNSQQEQRMKQMLLWLEAHSSEPVSVAQLAAATGVCVRECQRTFANILHTTPIQYLTRRRVVAAAEFLISTDRSVSEIGLSCGFDSPSYFARQFKSVTGMTPTEYRKRNNAPTEQSQEREI